MTSKKEVKEKAESLYKAIDSFGFQRSQYGDDGWITILKSDGYKPKKKFWNDKTIVWGLNCLMIFILMSLLITK